MIAAYRQPDRTRGRQLMHEPIESVSHEVPTALTEIIRGSDGPTEAINRRIEHLRGPALDSAT